MAINTKLFDDDGNDILTIEKKNDPIEKNPEQKVDIKPEKVKIEENKTEVEKPEGKENTIISDEDKVDDFNFGNNKNDINPEKVKIEENKTEVEKPEGKEKAITTEEDIFGTKTEDKPSDKSTDIPSIAFKAIGEKLGVKLEGETESEFIEKINAKVESSKKELKLDKYNPESKALINWLEEHTDSSLEDFFTNPVVSEWNSFIKLSPEDKYTQVRMTQTDLKDKTPEEVEEIITEELSNLSTRQLKDTADNITANAVKLRNDEIKKIVGDKKTFIETKQVEISKKVANERQILKDETQKIESILGVKLPEATKKQILAEIENGEIDKILNESPSQSKINAYLFKKYSSNIEKYYQNKLREERRAGYNDGIKKIQSDLYQNIPAIPTGGIAGGIKTEGKKFDAWKNKASIEGEDD